MNRAEWRALLQERFNVLPGQSPCDWPVEKIRRVIARDFPAFRRAVLRVIRRWHNLVVEVDRKYIFKFPWHPLAHHRREVRTLRALRGRLNVAIPDPMFVGRGGKFFGYPRIAGEPPRRTDVRRWSQGRRVALASALAELAARVQEAITPAHRPALLRPRPRPGAAAAEVREAAAAFGRIFSRSPRLVQAARRVFAESRRRCARVAAGDVRHVSFDLQFDNLLVDRQGRLAGVVDMGFLQWEDASGILGLLYKDDPGLTRMVAHELTRLTRIPISMREARAQGLYLVFAYLVEVSTNRWDMTARRREWLGIANRVVRGEL